MAELGQAEVKLEVVGEDLIEVMVVGVVVVVVKVRVLPQSSPE